MSSLIVNISRQGLVYIPVLFILKGILGVQGLIWAQPVADVLSLVLVVVFYTYSFRRFKISTLRDEQLGN
jgi:multidrug efflux pump